MAVAKTPTSRVAQTLVCPLNPGCSPGHAYRLKSVLPRGVIRIPESPWLDPIGGANPTTGLTHSNDFRAAFPKLVTDGGVLLLYTAQIVVSWLAAVTDGPICSGQNAISS